QALRAVFLDHARTISVDEEMWRLRMQVMAANPRLLPARIGKSAAIGQELVNTIASRTGTDPNLCPYPALVVTAAVAAARTAQQHYAANGFAESIVDILADAFDQLMAGLPGPPR